MLHVLAICFLFFNRAGAAGDGGETVTSPEPQAPLLPSYIDPNKKTFAARMMEKMGWKQGEGLGANKQGITAPLVARKTAMRSGIIVQVRMSKGTVGYKLAYCIRMEDKFFTLESTAILLVMSRGPTMQCLPGAPV